MNYSLKQINDIEVEPIKLKPVKTEDIKGYKYIPMLYSNIFICAKKNSGKTTVVYNILKNCINKSTKVVIFCSTHNNDKGWLEIKKWLEANSQPHIFYDAIMEDKVSNIELLIEKIKSDAEEKQQLKKDKKEGKSTPKSLLFNDVEEKKEKKPKKRNSRLQNTSLYLMTLAMS